MTQLFGFFTSDRAPFQFPGAPFLAASFLCVMALAVFQVVTGRAARFNAAD